MNKWENFNFEESVKRVFSNKAGEELMDFLVDAFVMQTTWREGKPDVTAFKEGEKNLVLTMKALLDKSGAGE